MTTSQTTIVIDAAALDALEAKILAATPGPWESFTEPGFSGWYAVRSQQTGNEIGSGDGGFCIEDADYIAAFDPPTALALIARVRAALVQADPRKPTDVSRRMRMHATNLNLSQDLRDDLEAGATEIERYYGGMMNWKSTAEGKDREFVLGRAAAPAQNAQPVSAAALDQMQDVLALAAKNPALLSQFKALRAALARQSAQQAADGPDAPTSVVHALEQLRSYCSDLYQNAKERGCATVPWHRRADELAKIAQSALDALAARELGAPPTAIYQVWDCLKGAYQDVPESIYDEAAPDARRKVITIPVAPDA